MALFYGNLGMESLKYAAEWLYSKPHGQIPSTARTAGSGTLPGRVRVQGCTQGGGRVHNQYKMDQGQYMMGQALREAPLQYNGASLK